MIRIFGFVFLFTLNLNAFSQAGLDVDPVDLILDEKKKSIEYYDEAIKEVFEKLKKQGMMIDQSFLKPFYFLSFEWEKNLLKIFPVYSDDELEISIKDRQVFIAGHSKKLRKKINQSIAVPDHVKFLKTSIDFKDNSLFITFF